MVRKLITKANVSVGTLPEMETIDPNIAVSHDTVKIYEHSTCLVTCGDSEVLPIPANSTRKKPTGSTRRILLIKSAFYAPVMRQIKAPPVAVVVGRLLCVGRIGKAEFPSRIHR